ncbi:hypothetical protein LSH36_610g00011 [Paralvinella palmiformis]|uniref:F-box domain-containing protein n=1 Tax=Paralvinella palmiformis TaxID=53620 RepID=A0AAD9J5D0_9ANNE|nr:hypothetical protein LSH36_610g00011 [Paralvinella palmiformis]
MYEEIPFDIESTYLQDSPSQDSSSGIASDDHNTASATSGSSPTYDLIDQDVVSTRPSAKYQGRSHQILKSRLHSRQSESPHYSGYESDYVDLAAISRREYPHNRQRHAYRETNLDDPESDCTFVYPERRVVHQRNCESTPPVGYASNSDCTPDRSYTSSSDWTPPRSYAGDPHRTPPNSYTGSPQIRRDVNKRHNIAHTILPSQDVRTSGDLCRITSPNRIQRNRSVMDYDLKKPNVCYFDIVPDDVVLRIFRYLTSDQLCRNCRVCLRWYNLVWDPVLWTSLRINDSIIDVDVALRTLTRRLSYETPSVCAIVEKINLSGCEKLTDRGLYTIARLCPDLRHLDLRGCLNISNIALFEVVSNCVNLEHLNVAGCVYVTCVCLTPEATIQAATYGKQIYLHYLDMTDCRNLDDAGLQIIASYCNKLTNLYLRRCSKVTDIGVQYVANYCTSLREFSISDCHSVTDLGLRELSKLGTNLRYLSVAKCGQISDVGVRYLARYCTRLRYLNVRGCDAVSDDSVDALARCCGRLRSLDIGKCDITDDGLQSLARYSKQLRKLSIKCCDAVTDRGIVDLAMHCPDLQQFNIQDCNVSMDAYRTVKRHCKHCVIEHTNPAFY